LRALSRSPRHAPLRLRDDYHAPVAGGAFDCILMACCPRSFRVSWGCPTPRRGAGDRYRCSQRQASIVACVLLNVAAAALLYPGLTQPLLTVVVKFAGREVLRQTRSTIRTIAFLHDEGAELPAFLILVFSVFVPLLKFVLLLIVALAPKLAWRRHVYLFVRNWSKWRYGNTEARCA
jgi:hypothetical protein